MIIVAGIAPATAAVAQTAMPASALASSPKAQVVMALKSAHKLLAAANHDYNGHRASADAAVRRALYELSSHHHTHRVLTPASNAAAAPSAGAAAAGRAAVHGDQATSDARLRQAQQILQGVLNLVGTNRPKAAVHVKTALTEINTALATR
jgi:hypothetical protein